jgi:D-alanyl-D-alanine carboxypeptidase/D-alanyl-D-alanine-endopeptidase (penicillin-binding protein 4)
MRALARAFAPILLATVLSGGACAARAPAPLAPAPIVEARDRRVRDLQHDLAALLDVPALERGLAAVVVRSADRGDTLFRYHDDTLVLPASNMKLVTLAAAAERLGWDYCFTTTIATTAPIVGGVLGGDLVVIGTGDPAIGGRDETANDVMDRWAETLWQRGLRHVDGRLVGDDRAFEGAGLGEGWAWDDVAWGYSAPVGALQANEDAAEVRIVPGVRAGEAATVTLSPPESRLRLVPSVTTGPAGAPASIELARRPGSDTLAVTGVIPAGSPPLVRTAAVEAPTTYFLSLLSSALARRGILVRGAARPIGDLAPAERPGAPATELLEHRSPPLREIAVTLMKASQNQYAETLLRALARSEPGATGTVAGGRDVVRRVLAGWSIPAETVVVADGSGLSRYNYVTAGTLAGILARMYVDPRHREPWLAALAVGGRDGTLERRFKGTPVDGRLRAKTGTLSSVRALSGYVPAANGEQILFVVVLNHVTAPSQSLDEVAERIVLRLARFER